MTDHANELRIYAGKIGRNNIHTKTVMRDAAAYIEYLEHRLREAEARVAEMEAERAQAQGYVTALRYIAWEAAGYMDCVHAAKRAIGEMGALPPPPKIQPAEAGDCK